MANKFHSNIGNQPPSTHIGRDSLPTVEPFPERHRTAMRSLKKKLDAFLEDPNEEENLHDVRTAIRRAEASMHTMSKRFRERQKAKRILSKFEDLMRRSVKVRDLDAVRARLSYYPLNSVLDRVLRDMERSRRRQLKSSIAVAASIPKLSHLCPDANDVQDEEKARKRLDKVVKKLMSSVDRELQVVLSEPDGTEALHALRKDSRRLRYSLEGMPLHGEDSTLVKTLTLWQDLLGAVRDGDVTIYYLEGLERSAIVDRILNTESARRRHDYEKFARTCSGAAMSLSATSGSSSKGLRRIRGLRKDERIIRYSCRTFV